MFFARNFALFKIKLAYQETVQEEGIYMGGELSKREGVLLHSFQSEAESFYCFFHRFTKIYALITNF